MKLFLALAVLVTAAQAVSFFELVNDEWTLYKVKKN